MRTIAFWLSLVLIFAVPWENVVVIAGLGTVSRAIGIIAAAFWLATVVVTGRIRSPRLFHVVVYLFVLWNVASFFWTADGNSTFSRILTYAQLAGLIAIVWDLYTTPTALQAGLQAYVLGGYVSIGSTLGNYLTAQEAAYNRYSATGFDPNDVGVMLALGIPLALHLAVSAGARSKLLRLVNYAYLPAALAAIILTGSRTAFIASIPALLFALGSLARLRIDFRLAILTALIVALYALGPVILQSPIQRIATSADSISSGDLNGRIELWHRGYLAYLERPFSGVGTAAVRPLIGSTTHNTYLSVLYETGAIGFGLFIVVLTLVAYLAARQSKWDTRMWLAVLAVWALGATTLTWEHRKPTWLFLSLIVIGASQSVRRSGAFAGSGAGEAPEGMWQGACDLAAAPPPNANIRPRQRGTKQRKGLVS